MDGYDQLTGKVSEEPLKTLAEFRAFGKSDVYFAQNVVAQPNCAGATIKVGDPVTILTRGDPVWDMEEVKAE